MTSERQPVGTPISLPWAMFSAFACTRTSQPKTTEPQKTSKTTIGDFKRVCVCVCVCMCVCVCGCPCLADSDAMGCIFGRERKRNKRQTNHKTTQIHTGIWWFRGLQETSKASPRGSKMTPRWPHVSLWVVFPKEKGRRTNDKGIN